MEQESEILPEGSQRESEESGRRDLGSHLSNTVLWAIFILIFLSFLILPLLNRGHTELHTAVVNGVEIQAPGDPITSIKSLENAHIVGKVLDKSDTSANALLEIGTIIGKSHVKTAGKRYTLAVGITDRTGIFMSSNSITIEGRNKMELWTAVWTFTSILSDIDINSTLPLYKIQGIFQSKQNVSLVIDMDNACSSYPLIISASGDIMQSLGFQQVSYKFNIFQYNKTDDKCSLQFSMPENLTSSSCPIPTATSLVITMRSGDSNVLNLKENELVLQYSDCYSMRRLSTLLRDLLAPDVLTGTRGLGSSAVL